MAADTDLVGADLAAARIPILLVWGEQDRWMPPAVGHRIRSEVLSQAPLVLMAHAGHAPYLERPEAFGVKIA